MEVTTYKCRYCNKENSDFNCSCKIYFSRIWNKDERLKRNGIKENTK